MVESRQPRAVHFASRRCSAIRWGLREAARRCAPSCSSHSPGAVPREFGGIAVNSFGDHRLTPTIDFRHGAVVTAEALLGFLGGLRGSIAASGSALRRWRRACGRHPSDPGRRRRRSVRRARPQWRNKCACRRANRQQRFCKPRGCPADSKLVGKKQRIGVEPIRSQRQTRSRRR